MISEREGLQIELEVAERRKRQIHTYVGCRGEDL